MSSVLIVDIYGKDSVHFQSIRQLCSFIIDLPLKPGQAGCVVLAFLAAVQGFFPSRFVTIFGLENQARLQKGSVQAVHQSTWMSMWLIYTTVVVYERRYFQLLDLFDSVLNFSRLQNGSVQRSDSLLVYLQRIETSLFVIYLRFYLGISKVVRCTSIVRVHMY